MGSDVWPLVGDDVERGEPGGGGEDPGRDGGEAEWPASGLSGRVIVMAAMAMDDSSRAGVALAEGAGWRAGRSMTASPVLAGSMNQPLRDKVALAWNPRRRGGR